MGHNKQAMKPGFSLEVDNQASLFTDAHAGWEQGTCQQKPINKCAPLAGVNEITVLWNTRPTLSSTLAMSCVWGACWYFWVDSRFFSNKNLRSKALSFQDMMQLPKHIGNFPAKPFFYMLPWAQTAGLLCSGKSTQQFVLGFRQHGQLPGKSAEWRLLFSPSSQADSYQWKLLQICPLSVPLCLLCQGSNHQHQLEQLVVTSTAICSRALQSVKLLLTGFALLGIFGMNLAQNTGLTYSNFRLQDLLPRSGLLL